MTAVALEEAHRLLRISKTDAIACAALLAAPGVRFAVTLRYDDIDVELMSPEALLGVVETMIVWADKSVATLADDAAPNT